MSTGGGRKISREERVRSATRQESRNRKRRTKGIEVQQLEARHLIRIGRQIVVEASSHSVQLSFDKGKSLVRRVRVLLLLNLFLQPGKMISKELLQKKNHKKGSEKRSRRKRNNEQRPERKEKGRGKKQK
jgi:hypothetical protein